MRPRSFSPLGVASSGSPLRLVVLLLVSWGLLALAVQRWDTAGAWRATETRGRAVERVRRAAAAVGLETEGFRARVRGRQDIAVAFWWRDAKVRGREFPGRSVSALSLEVVLQSREDDAQVYGTLDGAGKILSLDLRRDSSKSSSEELQSAAAETLALESLVALEMVSVPRSRALGDPTVEDRGMGRWRLGWQLGDEATDRGPKGEALPSEELEVTLSGADVVRVRRHREIEEDRGFSSDREDFGAFLVLAAFLAAVLYLVQSRRFFHPHRRILTLGVLAAMLGWVGVILTFGQRVFDGGAIGTWVGALFDPVLYRSVGALLFFGAGCAVARRALPTAIAPLETALAGTWRRRPILRSTAVGLALGPSLALVLTLVAVVLGRDLQLLGGSPEAAAGRWPFLIALAPRLSLGTIAAFGMLAPWLRHLLPWERLARGLTIFGAAFLLVEELPLQGDSSGLVLAALVVGFFLEQIFHRWGLLAVLVTSYGFGAALRSASLAIQPGPLMFSGALACAVLAAGCWGLARIADRFPEGLLSPESLALTPRHRAQREQIRAQLQVAREAQARMLPAHPPTIPGWSLAARCQPAQEVGGDLYDFVPIGDRWAISQGDVSGKGMVASLFMTLTKGLLLAATEYLEKPSEVLSAVNEGLYRETDRDIFVTLWYGLLDPANGRLIHARAGHNSVLWRRPTLGETVALLPKGLAAGAVKSSTFSLILEDEEVFLEPGDALFVYTDGISEAMDENREEYGLDRLEEIVGQTDGMAAQEALDHVLADVRAFCGQAPVHDDLTLIVIRCEGSAPTGPDRAGRHED